MFTARHFLTSFLAVLLFCFLANAQEASQTSPSASPVVPRLVNFSGRATDTQGKAISGIAGATFAIYKDQYEGSPLWLETQNVQADNKGNYTVQLGATKPEGLPLDLFSSGEARWLGVTVNGGQEQPRILLLSVPYALKAADAETIGGLPPSAFVLANKGQVSGTATTKSAPAGTQKNTAPPANPAVTGVGVTDFIPMWDSTSDIIDSIMFQKSSQIGVNTTSPAATLDVNGKTDIRDTLTLFPKGTDSTLVVNGTNFKVDQTGKVTFISGQTFPGTGTVTSVGLSAPSSDFTVSGTPVTKSGTLNLKWKVAPTNADTANAIVKRDSTGRFSAGAVTVASVTAAPLTGTGIFSTSPDNHGIEGFTNSTAASGVLGENNSSGGSGVYGAGLVGVYGTTSNSSSYGVVGVNTATGGIGIHGSAPNGDGFFTENNVQQSRTAGGWVKAMALVDQNGIGICFNSTLIGAPATVSPCGFTFHAWGPGDYTIDFGFQVSDRFVSTTPGGSQLPTAGPTTTACVLGLGGLSCNNTITANQVEVTNLCAPGTSFSCSGHYSDNEIYVIVY
jgi:hypothetical protein